jgi:hypothetical protein
VAVLRRPSAAAPEPSLPWQPIRQDTRLSPTFAYRAILPAPQAEQTLRVRLYGQTRIVALVLSADRIAVEERTGKTESRELAAVTPTNWQDGNELTIVKTPDSLSAYRNGERLIATPCPLEQWRMVRWDALGDFEPSNASFQKIGRLVFADDFMHGENELGQWRPESGEWTVHELQNPIRSANPFSFLGTGDNAVAAAGQWFWRNYRVAASAHPLPGASFGISFCRRGPDTAYDLRWSHVGPDAVLELSRIHAGQRQSLARQPLPCRANGWVQLAASQLDGLIVVLVDGRPVLSVTDSAPLCGGGVALWTDGGEGTVFDDVSVGPVDRVSLTPDASIPGTILPSGSLGTTTDREECLIGGILLGNATVEATVACSGRTSPLGLVARANGAKQLRFQLVPGTPWQAQVVAVTPAGETVLASEDTAAPDGEATLGFTVLDNEAWGTVGGKIAVYAPQVRTVGQGLTGLFARTEPIRATRLAVSPTSPLPSIDNRVETFTHEQSMQNWNSPVLAWTPDYSGSLPLYWHRSDFWRDVSVQADIESLRKQSSVSAWGVAMAAEGGTDDGPEPRWELYATPGTSEIFVQRPGQEPIQIPFAGELRTLALERRGNRILAKPNGHVAWQDRLPDKGDGLLRVGRIGRGATDEWAQAVTICADSLRTYSFKEAPVDWLPAAGEWKITNRWECDPRWSFFSGVQRGGPACLWSKLQHGRNVTIEFFVGPKMDRDRGKWYEYAADFNAVICADGQDISSGYSFLFGGWDDRGSQIVRGHEILAENRNITIPRKSSTHRRWFHVKIRKRGDQLTFWVDGAVVGTARDDSPLAGNRFGLWTYDNGIMVAQVRIATNGELSAVDLGTVPKSRPLTPYDKQP